jgi:hypothetical protein
MAIQAICPSCGAQINNYVKCEYCGSHLIRLHELNNLTSTIYSGLIEAIQKNLSSQGKSNSLYIVTKVKGYSYLDISVRNYITYRSNNDDDLIEFVPDSFNDNKTHLMLLLRFSSRERRFLDKFKKHEIYKIFFSYLYEQDEHLYMFDFEDDMESLIKILSTLLSEIFEIPIKSLNLKFENSESKKISPAMYADNRAIMEKNRILEYELKKMHEIKKKSIIWAITLIISIAIIYFYITCTPKRSTFIILPILIVTILLTQVYLYQNLGRVEKKHIIWGIASILSLLIIHFLTQVATYQVIKSCKSVKSIFSNSDLCTTNFRLVKGCGL